MINNNSNKKYYTYGKYTLGGGNFIKKLRSPHLIKYMAINPRVKNKSVINYDGSIINISKT